MQTSCTVLEENIASTPLDFEVQRTLKKGVEAEGVGVFTGEKAAIRLLPSEVSGVVFKRVDLPGHPCLPARLEYVQGTPRCTVLGHQGVSVQTVEHLLAALKAFQIHNVMVEISGPEVPIFDGSSVRFVEMLREAEAVELDARRPVYTLQAPVSWSQGGVHLVGLPSSEYRVSYTLHYPTAPVIGTQFYSILVNKENFEKEVASCRTFSVYEEIAPLIERGLVKGGSLESAVVFKENQVMNPEGLRFSNEPVRHKLLDLIGDLSLMPFSFKGHILAICSGHYSNNEFAKQMFNHIKMENL